MITSKYITQIVSVLAAAAVLFCMGGMIYSDRLVEMTGGKAVFMEYESRLFDRDQIMSVDIQIDANDWEELLAHAIEENYYECNVEINGTTFSNVGIRPKGNTSLTSIANDPDTDRYSLKLEFDRYVAGQTCFGLDKLVLNNNYADATNMKEAIVYDMYRYLDADASLYNYAKVSVNGEYWGVYLALEAVEESFLLRNYGVETGELYKPEGMDGNGGEHAERFENKRQDISKETDMTPEDPNGQEMIPMPPESPSDREMAPISPEYPSSQEMAPISPEYPNGQEMVSMPPENQGLPDQDRMEPPDFQGRGNRSGDGKGPGSMGGGGANLNYTDDALDSYTTIWEGAVTDTADADHQRVITALKEIQAGTNLEEYLNVEAVLKYMAVHTFAVNLDSLSGNMPHNYYLYESDGQLNILPWDYNLAFGGMSMGKNNSASETVNYPIDTPFSSTQFFDALLKDETYLAKYHGYLKQLVEEYVQNKRFDMVYTKIRTQIDDLVKTDPTAFYSYDQYDAGAKMLVQMILLRAESISGQLAGTIPSTSMEQQENPDALLNASEIDLSVLGEFHTGNRDAKEQNMQKPADANLNMEKKTFPQGENHTENSASKNITDYGICGIILLLAFLPVCLYHRKKRYPK